jgi:peptidoglycan/xylan/chitin deacetylase (PgdA/CDA1 family)
MNYHGVVQQKGDPRLERNFHLLSEFRLQVKFLLRQSIIPLAKLAGDGGFPRLAAAITFDDGYANNLLAADILAKAGLPWTVFISTGAIGPKGIIWTVELSLLLLHGHSKGLDMLGQAWPLAAREEREGAFQAIRYRLKAMPAKLRQKTMNEIRTQFPASETERLLEQFPAFQMLTWKEVRQLAESGVEIGSHGVDHEIHHAAQDSEVRRRELVESKKEIERQIGKPCKFFAFPNGDTCESSAREVEEAGYEMAFTTRQGFMRPDSNRFLLPRISPGASAAKLKQQWRDLRNA